MCGRYVSPDEASIERKFNLVHQEWQFPSSFNVAPTQAVPIVRIAADVPGATGRRGRTPLLQNQIERLHQLPKTQQKVVMQMLDGVLAQANR